MQRGWPYTTIPASWEPTPRLLARHINPGPGRLTSKYTTTAGDGASIGGSSVTSRGDGEIDPRRGV